MVPPAEPLSPKGAELATLYRTRPIAPPELTPLMRRYVPNAVALRLDSGAVSGSDVLSEIREVSVVFINLKGLRLAQQGAAAHVHAHGDGGGRGGGRGGGGGHRLASPCGIPVVRRRASQKASVAGGLG